MGSDEIAITIPGALEKLTFFTGTGRHRVQILYFFLDVDRPSYSLRDSSGVGWSPRQHALVLGAPQRALDRKLWGIMVVVRALLGTCTDMYPLIEAPAHAVSAFAYV